MYISTFVNGKGPVITLKQLEAIYCIVELGSFEAASMKLIMSQSAISKRVQEMEDVFDVQIFDRSKRSARLTERGTELFEYAADMLRQRDYLLERISSTIFGVASVVDK